MSGTERSLRNASSVIGVVPVEIGVTEGPADGGLADLARPGDQGHLTVSFEVVSQDSGVKTPVFVHGTFIAAIVKQSRPFYDVRVMEEMERIG